MSGRLFIVTGASRGIGRALALEARIHGCVTATAARGHTDGDHTRRCDLADPGEWPGVKEWLNELISSTGWDRVVLVHNAATVEPIGFAGEVDPWGLERQVQLNFGAPVILGDAFIRSATGVGVRAVMIQITSGAAATAYPGWSGYGPAKAAVDHWVRTVGMEQDLRRNGISVMSVAPGVVDTDMQSQTRAADNADFPDVDRFRELHERGALASPGDVAANLFALAMRDDIENGAVLDLRTV